MVMMTRCGCGGVVGGRYGWEHENMGAEPRGALADLTTPMTGSIPM